MTLSSIISISISLTFIYLLLSLAASELQEILASFLNLRSQHLKKHIYALFGEEPLEDGLQFGKFIKSFFKQKSEGSNSEALVEKLYEKYLKPPLQTGANQKRKQSQEPEEISPKQFADSLIELIRDELNMVFVIGYLLFVIGHWSLILSAIAP
jgi:hypothetical protein